jgi:hypothetical protein
MQEFVKHIRVLCVLAIYMNQDLWLFWGQVFPNKSNLFFPLSQLGQPCKLTNKFLRFITNASNMDF